jgi:hypothetical protein
MLSPGKRQSLTREVESLQVIRITFNSLQGSPTHTVEFNLLQLVVEMRTTELHKLREERTRHLHQLDELEKTKAQLEKVNARVEDLTVQLATKTELERYIILHG